MQLLSAAVWDPLLTAIQTWKEDWAARLQVCHLKRQTTHSLLEIWRAGEIHSRREDFVTKLYILVYLQSSHLGIWQHSRWQQCYQHYRMPARHHVETTLRPSHLFGKRKFPFKRLMVIRKSKSLFTKDLCSFVAIYCYHWEIIITLLKWKVKNQHSLGVKSPQFPMFNGNQEKKNKRERMQCLVIAGSTNACTKNFVLLWMKK